MAGWYEKSTSKDGQFQFVLKAGNGEIILRSELYKSTASVDKGIASVRNNCGDDARYERLDSSNGKSYFNLKAGNNQIIGTSQMYASEASRATGVASVRNNGPTDKIKDLTVG